MDFAVLGWSKYSYIHVPGEMKLMGLLASDQFLVSFELN